MCKLQNPFLETGPTRTKPSAWSQESACCDQSRCNESPQLCGSPPNRHGAIFKSLRVRDDMVRFEH